RPVDAEVLAGGEELLLVDSAQVGVATAPGGIDFEETELGESAVGGHRLDDTGVPASGRARSGGGGGHGRAPGGARAAGRSGPGAGGDDRRRTGRGGLLAGADERRSGDGDARTDLPRHR